MKKIWMLLFLLCLPLLAQNPYQQGRSGYAQNILWRDLHPSTQDSLRKVIGDSVAALSIDGFSLFVNADNQIAQKVYADTTALKAASGDSLGSFVNLKQLSSSNTNGGGMFVYADSAYPENGVFSFDSGTQGKQWVRQDLLGKRPYYLIDYGVVPNDSTYSASNTDIINAICLEAYTGSNFLTKTGMVIPPSGDVWVEKTPGTNYCINIQSGIIFQGMGNGTQKNGTRLRVRANQSASGDTLIVVMNANAWDYYDDGSYLTTAWWHTSHLRYVAIDCNGNNQAGKVSGIDIHRPGEASSVTNVSVANYKGWGVRVRSSAAPHLRMASVSVFPASSADTTADYSYSARKGFWFDNGGGTNATGLSGDGNRPLVYMGTAGNGEAFVHVNINHLKFESGNSSAPGWSVSCPVVIDTVNRISSSLRIVDLSATRGTDITAVQDYLIYMRGSNATNHNIHGVIHYSQATGFDVLFKSEFGATVDSVVNLSNDYVTTDAAQVSGNIEFGSSNTVDYSNLSPAKAYNSGFYFFNQNGWVVKSLYMSSSDFLVRSAYTGMVLEDSAGVDWFDLNTSDITAKRRLSVTSGLQMNAALIVDSMKYSGTGDSLQFYFRSIGWRAIPLFNSQGN